MNDPVVIGHVVSVHPAQRSLRVAPVRSRLAEFDGPDRLHVLDGDAPRPLKVAAVTAAGDLVQVALAPVVSRDLVASLKSAAVVVEAARAKPRSTTEYGLDELEGLDAFAGEERIGSVAAALKTKAGGVLEIERGGESLLVPMAPGVIRNVDWQRGRLELGDFEDHAIGAEARA